MKSFNRKLVLEDGGEYCGYGFGSPCQRICELVFNTSMVGYQEIVSDPSYTDQAVVMTYPLIGNYGITDDDFECKNPSIGALIVYDYNDRPSNFRYTKTLSELLEENGIPGIYGVDTRRLTRSIRDFGSRRCIITDISTPVGEALEIIKNTPVPHDAVARVSCKKRWYSRTANPQFNVVALDCGIKLGIVRSLNRLGCNVTVVPYNTAADVIDAMKPDGIFLSNGPGNPEDVTEVIGLVRALKGKYPIFGICLGHQLTALAMGGKTMKLKYGHRGVNQPVKQLETGRTYISSQNHGYAVVAESLDRRYARESFINANDGTCEGMEYRSKQIFTVQFHPEACSGPKDTKFLFDRFISMMGGKNNAAE